MGANPLAITALAICSAVWLMAAVALGLSLLQRLPARHTSNAGTFRLQLAAVLALMTMAVLSQVSALAHWSDSVRETLSILTIIVAIGAMAATVTSVTIHRRTKRAQETPDQ